STNKIDRKAVRRLVAEATGENPNPSSSTMARQTMRAMVLRAHGGPDAVRPETDFPDPEAGPGDVVLRVRATSLNYHDIFTRRGMPGIKIPMPAIMGLDVAGEIVEVGPEVEGGWKVG